MIKTLTDLQYIGSFTVDSGQAMVGDPCYLDEWKNWDSDKESFDEHPKHSGEYGYLGASNATLGEGFGDLGLGRAVAFSTGYGDGIYPVYAKLNEDGRITKIVIDFETEDED
jgi:hypothetical protein